MLSSRCQGPPHPGPGGLAPLRLVRVGRQRPPRRAPLLGGLPDTEAGEQLGLAGGHQPAAGIGQHELPHPGRAHRQGVGVHLRLELRVLAERAGHLGRQAVAEAAVAVVGPLGVGRRHRLAAEQAGQLEAIQPLAGLQRRFRAVNAEGRADPEGAMGDLPAHRQAVRRGAVDALGGPRPAQRRRQGEHQAVLVALRGEECPRGDRPLQRLGQQRGRRRRRRRPAAPEQPAQDQPGQGPSHRYLPSFKERAKPGIARRISSALKEHLPFRLPPHADLPPQRAGGLRVIRGLVSLGMTLGANLMVRPT
jgi:hypothetical protein